MEIASSLGFLQISVARIVLAGRRGKYGRIKKGDGKEETWKNTI